MILDYNEIVKCIIGCELHATYEDVSQPKQPFVQNVINEMLDGVLGINIKDMVPRLQSAATKAGVNADNNNFMDNQADARLLMAHQRKISHLMFEIGIRDFSIMDIIKPEPERTRRIFSALINFIRFRASPTKQWNNMMNSQDTKSQELDQILMRRDELQAKVEQMESEQARYLEHKADLETRKTHSENKLRQLMREADIVGQKRIEYKEEKANLITQLQEGAKLLEEKRKQTENLKKYVFDPENPPSEINKRLNNQLTANREKLVTLERRIRGLEVSTEAFKTTKAEIDKCIKIVNECQNEEQREDEARRKWASSQEVYERSKLRASELDRTIAQLERRMKTNTDKVERVRQQTDRKKEAARERMAELQDQYSTLIAERAVADQDIERIKKEIISTEENMYLLRRDAEIKAVDFEKNMQELSSTLDTYLNDLQLKISEKSRTRQQ